MKKLIYILHTIETGGVEVAVLSAIPKLIEKAANVEMSKEAKALASLLS